MRWYDHALSSLDGVACDNTLLSQLIKATGEPQFVQLKSCVNTTTDCRTVMTLNYLVLLDHVHNILTGQHAHS